MANYERDKDDVRVFDGGEDDETEGSHLPVVIIIAILVLAAFGGVVWLAYNQGVARGRSDVPVQMAANNAGKGEQIKVYQQPAGSEDEESVQPAPANPQAAEAEAKPEPPPPAPSQPVRVAQTTAAPVPAQNAPPAALTPAKPVPQPQAQPQATKPPAPLGLAHPAEQASPPVQATALPAKPATVTPKPAAAAAAPKPVAAVPAKPVETKSAAVAPGSYLLQIGAYKSEDEAMAAWKAYQLKHAALLMGFSPNVQRADLGGKGVWYRLRISSFSDKNTAVALCDRLKSENANCFLAR